MLKEIVKLGNLQKLISKLSTAIAQRLEINEQMQN